MNPEPASYRGQTTEDKEAQKQAHTCIRVSWNWAWCKSCVRTNDEWTKPSKYTSEHFMKKFILWKEMNRWSSSRRKRLLINTVLYKSIENSYRQISRFSFEISPIYRRFSASFFFFFFSDVFPMKYHYNDIRARGISSLQRNIATAIYVGRGCVIAIYRSSDITL